MTFTAAELEAALEDEENEDFQDMWWEVESIFDKPVLVPVNGRPVLVELLSYDSGIDPQYLENYKTNIEIILKADGRLFRKTGYHQSFTGGDFDGPFEEVKSVEKVVTVYESA